MAMSTSPAADIETNTLEIHNSARKRGTVRITEKLDTDLAARKRGTVRI